MKYRKKPVIVEAIQWFKMGDHPRVIMREHPEFGRDRVPMIYGLEGWHIVSIGDWIITGVQGEQYPCKPNIFVLTYDPVQETVSK